jgi:hypothetical protein
MGMRLAVVWRFSDVVAAIIFLRPSSGAFA